MLPVGCCTVNLMVQLGSWRKTFVIIYLELCDAYCQLHDWWVQTTSGQWHSGKFGIGGMLRSPLLSSFSLSFPLYPLSPAFFNPLSPLLHPLPFPPVLPSLPCVRSRPHTARGRGSAVCSPSQNRIWCILALKSDI